MRGGEIDRRIMDLIYSNYMVLNLDRDWLESSGRTARVILNNGDYICDATALRLRVYATDKRYQTPGVDVTKKVQSMFQGKFKTDLGKYADLFGDPAPGQEKTLKLRVQDLGGNVKYMELPEDAPIEL